MRINRRSIGYILKWSSCLGLILGFFLPLRAQNKAIQNVACHSTEEMQLEITYGFFPKKWRSYQIRILISTDGGQHFKDLKNAYGDVGRVKKSGTKKAIWPILPNEVGFGKNQVICRVDGKTRPTNLLMGIVAIGAAMVGAGTCYLLDCLPQPTLTDPPGRPAQTQ